MSDSEFEFDVERRVYAMCVDAEAACRYQERYGASAPAGIGAPTLPAAGAFPARPQRAPTRARLTERGPSRVGATASDCETARAVRELCVAHGATFLSEVARHLGASPSTTAGRLERLYQRGILADARTGSRAPGSPAPAGARLLYFARPASEACP